MARLQIWSDLRNTQSWPEKKKSGLNLTGSVTRTRPESPRIMLVALTANRLEDKSLDVSTKDCLDGGHGVGKDHPNLQGTTL